ncbi:MAG: hypothetical protein Q9218_004155 [Villophora microphyllina]
MSADPAVKPNLDAEIGHSVSEKELVDSPTALKTSHDGHILYPQPSEDPNDPLNWSWGKKHLILLVISATSFLADYGSATGAVTLIPQAA